MTVTDQANHCIRVQVYGPAVYCQIRGNPNGIFREPDDIVNLQYEDWVNYNKKRDQEAADEFEEQENRGVDFGRGCKTYDLRLTAGPKSKLVNRCVRSRGPLLSKSRTSTHDSKLIAGFGFVARNSSSVVRKTQSILTPKAISLHQTQIQDHFPGK
jgi:hypothetical protein